MLNVMSWRRAMELGPISMPQGNYRLLCYYYLVEEVPIDGKDFTHFAELLVVALGYEAELWARACSLEEYTSGMSSSKEFLKECVAFAKAKMQIYTRAGSNLALLNEAKRLIEVKGLCTIAELDWRMSLLPTPYMVDLEEIWKNVNNGDTVRRNHRHLQEFYTVAEEFTAKSTLTDDPFKLSTTQRVHDPATGRKINSVVKHPTINSSSTSTDPQVPQNELPQVVHVLKPYHHLAVDAYLELHNHLHKPGGLNLGKATPILFQPNRGHPARIQPEEQTRTTNSLPAGHSQLQPGVRQRDKAVVADPQWHQRYFPIPPLVSTSTSDFEPVRPCAILNTTWTITLADIENFLRAGRVAPPPPPPVVPIHLLGEPHVLPAASTELTPAASVGPPDLLREPQVNPRVFPAASCARPPTSSAQVISPQPAATSSARPPTSSAQVISSQAAGASTASPAKSSPDVTVRQVHRRGVRAPGIAGRGSSTTVSSESTRTITSTAGCSSDFVCPEPTRSMGRRPNVTRRGRPWSTTTTTTSNPVVAQPTSVQTNPVQSYTRRYCPSSVPLASRLKFYQGKMHWRPVNKPKPDQ